MAERYLIPSLPAAGYDFVPEQAGKKQAAIERLSAEKAEAQKAKDAEWERVERESAERAARYDAQFQEHLRSSEQLHAEAAAKGGYYREAEPKVVFVVRLHGINKVAPKPKKILQLFRLRQLNNGVFMKVNKSTGEMLKVVAPFVTFGSLSRSAIRALVYKRGYAKTGKRGAWARRRIDSNRVISDSLGQYGLHSVDDLVNELHSCGPHFKQASNFLWPFKLSAPRGGWIAKRRGFTDPRKGDWGDRGPMMSTLVKRMV